MELRHRDMIFARHRDRSADQYMPSRPHLIALFVLSSCAVLGQGEPAWRTRLSLGGGITFQAATLVGHTTPSAAALPFVGLALDMGAALTYRNKWGVAFQAGAALQGYYMQADTVRMDLFHLLERSELRVFRLTDIPGISHLPVRFALAVGYSFQQASEERTTKQPFQVVSREATLTRLYLAPEVGLTNGHGYSRMEFGLRYVAHLDRTKSWTSTFTGPSGVADFAGTDDHLAIVLRYHFGWPPKERPAPAIIQQPRPPFADRRTDTLATVITHQQRATLKLWDNAEIDGDTVSVLLNGKVVLSEYGLTNERHRIKLDLAPGNNDVLIVAHNEGRVRPNTASAQLKTGGKKHQLLIRTSTEQNTAMVIQRY